MAFTKSNHHRIFDLMTTLPERGATSNSKWQWEIKCNSCPTVRPLSSLWDSNPYRLNNCNNWTFKIKMVNRYSLGRHQLQTMIQILKRDLQPLDSWKMASLNNLNNQLYHHHTTMVWALILNKLIKTTDSNFISNKTSKFVISRIIHNYRSPRIIIQKWEWVWNRITRGG